jgi:hypothetical protein
MRFIQYSKLRFPLTRVPRSTTSLAGTAYHHHHHHHHSSRILSIVYSTRNFSSLNQQQLRLNRCYSKSSNETKADVQVKHNAYQSDDGDWNPTAADGDAEAIVVYTQSDLQQLIELQKERAIALWEQSKKAGYFNEADTVYTEVLEQLHDGKVPPYFHTLCRNPKYRLYFPRNRFEDEKGHYDDDVTSDDDQNVRRPHIPSYIQLSTKAVKAGVAENLENGKIPSRKEDSYLTGFFCEEIKTARVNVIDDRLSKVWEFDDGYTKLVTDLVNEPAEMKGHDIEVTQMKSAFEVDAQSGTNLITRSLSRGVVADCFRGSREESVHTITGNPGIGKSWTLVYALQQALLYENACVMFCFQKVGAALVCIRRDNQIFVWYNDDESLEQHCTSQLFGNSNVLVLLDPREDGAKYSGGRRRLIFAASNNAKHFNNVFKVTPSYMKILNVLSDGELKIALKYMSSNYDTYSDKRIEQMIRRSKNVGNLPWYLFSDKRQKILEKKLKRFSQYTNKEQIANLLTWDGVHDMKVDESIAGAIFSIGATFDVLRGDVGYDGHVNVDYEEAQISFLSDLAVAVTYRNTLNYWGKVTDGNLNVMGTAVEKLVWRKLKTIKLKTPEW